MCSVPRRHAQTDHPCACKSRSLIWMMQKVIANLEIVCGSTSTLVKIVFTSTRLLSSFNPCLFASLHMPTGQHNVQKSDWNPKRFHVFKIVNNLYIFWFGRLRADWKLCPYLVPIQRMNDKTCEIFYNIFI